MVELIIQLLILAVLLIVIPTLVGGIFAYVDKGRGKLLFRWISGQFMLWAGFQLIAVPLIWKQADFDKVVIAFWCYMAALIVFAAGVEVRYRARGYQTVRPKRVHGKKFLSVLMLWFLFFGLLVFQIVQSARLAYGDGNDAFYVAISAITQESGTMYLKAPYTGARIALDMRNGLAPFPMWIAFLAKMSGMQAVTVVQLVMPIVLIFMSYGVFALLGVKFFPKGGEQRPLFLVFVALMFLLGGDSLSGAEKFLLARTGQGRAVLGCIVIPFLVLVLMLILRKLHKKEEIVPNLYVLLGAVTTAGCLCSMAGTLLMCLGVGIVGLVSAVYNRQIRALFPMAVCCIPCACFAILYLVI